MEPSYYHALLDVKQIERGIRQIEDSFQQNPSIELCLRRIAAPLLVLKGLGTDGDFNGAERPVSFPIKDLGDAEAEVIHSLVKRKRLTLTEYSIQPSYGTYTDMNAVRVDEELGNLHSLYVNQQDQEAVIIPEQRVLPFLKNVAERIYTVLLRTEYLTCETYPQLKPFLPGQIHFIHSEDLLRQYPDLSPKEREDAIREKYDAVFITGTGSTLSNGEKHDGHVPDYDDWSTVIDGGQAGLNGDVLIWYPVLGRSVELPSMGIRMDRESLLRQLRPSGQKERQKLYFHQQLFNGRLSLSIGSDTGQSRLHMVLLQKVHIDEIQASIWSEDMHEVYNKLGMRLI